MNIGKLQPQKRNDQGYGTSGRAEEQAQLAEGMAEVFQLKLTLEGSKPAIWRRLWVPAGISLADLHGVIQLAMDWEDAHLHQFIAGTRNRGPLTFFSDPVMVGDGECLDEARARLDAMLLKPKDKLRYEYDFGDSWLHSLVLEKILTQPALEAGLPRCVAGERACPPEDSGGMGGWQALREALADPSHPDHEAYGEGFDPEFDPEAFDLEAINTALRRAFTPKPKRGKARKGA